MHIVTFFSHYVPYITKSMVQHLLKLSPSSSHWTFKTAFIISFIRAVFRDPKPGTLLHSQQASFLGTEVESPTHLIPVTLAVPTKSNIEDIVFNAIRELGNGAETFSEFEVQPVTAEWVAPLKGAVKLDNSISSDYFAMMRDVQNDTTILYFHGGQFWRMGRKPRVITRELAKETGGRCLGVRFRLAPQNPFPSALIDGLVAYLSLLYPPPGSMHNAILPGDICFAGDSAGGNLVIALVQLLLEIRRSSGTIMWCGQERDILLPAGVSALSPYTDLTRALDSEALNLKYDIVPARGAPFLGYSPSPIWHTNPPRHHVYANDNALCHPLVSPVTAEDWSGSPPTWICVGEECLADQGMLIAQIMASQQVPVMLELFSAMPHNFPLLVETESSEISKARWAGFIRTVINDAKSVQTKALRWSGRVPTPTPIDIHCVVPICLGDLKGRMASQIKQWGAPPAGGPS